MPKARKTATDDVVYRTGDCQRCGQTLTTIYYIIDPDTDTPQWVCCVCEEDSATQRVWERKWHPAEAKRSWTRRASAWAYSRYVRSKVPA